MWGKEVFLRKTFNLKILKLVFVLIFFSWPIKSDENTYLKDASTYLGNLDEFSSSFLQIQNNEISKGLLFLKGNRLRIEYTSPSNIIFVLKNNRVMYFNAELQEVQYFSPKNTIGQFFIDLFNKENFLLNSQISRGKGYFIVFKEIVFEKEKHQVEIYFEEKPLQLRKFQIINNEGITTFSILNPNFNPNLNNKIFSLANPLLG